MRSAEGTRQRARGGPRAVLGASLALLLAACQLLPRDSAPGGVPRSETRLLPAPRLAPDPGYGESAWVRPSFPFDELLASWNLDVPAGCGAAVAVQVEDADGVRSPWLDVGEWGELPDDLRRTGSFDGGRVDVDYVRLERPFARARVRVRSVGPDVARVALLALTFSDRHGRYAPAPPPAERAMPPGPVARLAVPFRSQRAAAPALAPRVCSPTSVAMVLAYRGVRASLEQVAALAYDRRHDLYGSWPRAVQAAYVLGVPGYVARFDGWRAVHDLLAAGQPLVVSVRAAPGELRGAPYEETDGHLLVLAGVDAAGDLLVDDPAAPDALRGVTTYARTDLERCWLANGGTAYVLLPRTAEDAAPIGRR